MSLQYEGHLLPQNWSCNPERYPITALDRFGAQGLFPQMSVAQNLIFPALRRLCGPFGLLDKGLERAALQEWDGKDQLNGKNMAQLTQAQAIALQMESWTLARRKVLILLEPFLHTDNASRSVLQRAFARFREQGWSHSGDLFQPDILPWHFGTRRRCRAVGTMVRPDLGCSGGVPR